MALETIVRETGRLVIGISCILVVLLVARPAIRGCAAVLTVDMALCALDGEMCAD